MLELCSFEYQCLTVPRILVDLSLENATFLDDFPVKHY